ncbi:terminase large subunit [Xylella fastidiosa subsp. multiplex]|nr:terminase family protein [Xylella fastidiosa]MDC7969409.1 terminase family protein [Xylella fastidiosa subsp. multiplex]MDD0936680.1 terminase large subunit [Xylella fastidiosa subsp. multiplex]
MPNWMQPLQSLPPKQALALLLEEKTRRRCTNQLADYAPYLKQSAFHALGATVRERLLIAANQSGKTLCAGYEAAIHLTGRYPDWWQGKRFTSANHGLAGSETGELTRRGVQRVLLGRDPKTELGTGAIPGACIDAVTWARGVPELVDTIYVRHCTGARSSVSLKSFDQGREKWQADTVHWVWFDEEPPEDVYFEGITRTNRTFGPVFMTFTPLKGMSNVVRRFLTEDAADRGYVQMSIEDAEHYSAEECARITASYPPHERDARTQGVPALGSGRVFPIAQEEISVAPFAIPAQWALIGGMDFGYDHPFAAVKLAWDRDADILYVVCAYRKREATPIIHAAALKPWGVTLPWAWPHDGLQHDKGSGDQLAEQYRQQGLAMLPQRATFEDGTNGLEAGVTEMLDRMHTGRLKVFSHLAEWFEECSLYHRDNGRITKRHDDLLSATRYAMMMRRYAKITNPVQIAVYEYTVDY